MIGFGKRRKGFPKVPFVLATIALLVFAVGWFVYPSEELLMESEKDISESTEERGTPDPAHPAHPYFHPEKVLDNPECRQHPGLGPSSDVAVVLLPTQEGARFAAVDASGILHAGTLPFFPERYTVARREGGSVITAFGPARFEGDEIPPIDGLPPLDYALPMRVYLGDQTIFENDHIWDFGLANDGSSFYVIQPVAGETSRLTIHNLDTESTHHYDIGHLYPKLERWNTWERTSNEESNYYIRYSLDYGELMFVPAFLGVGTHHFFPTSSDAREPRKISVSDDEGAVFSTFASSREGYFLLGNNDRFGPRVVIRREYSWPSGQAQTETWKKTLSDGSPHSYLLHLSQDGSRMLLFGDEIQLLDTANGETLFLFPRDDLKDQLPRMSRILGPDATEEQVGTVVVADFHENQLVLFRELSSLQAASEGFAYDLFDLDTIELDSGPSRRVTTNADVPCESGDHFLRGLQEHDGRLTFLTTRG